MTKQISKKPKKAQMHVEVVLSFTLFLSAVLVIFFFLNPLAKTDKDTININFIERVLLNEVSAPVGVMSVITSKNNIDNCYNFPDDYVILYGEIFTEFKTPDPRKYILYFSSLDFFDKEHPNNKPLSACPLKDTENNELYEFGVYLTEDIVIYGKIQDLIIELDSDLTYQDLKKRLDIKNDFTFKIKGKDRAVISDLTPISKKPPKGRDISAKEFPIRVIKGDGTVLELILNIQAW